MRKILLSIAVPLLICGAPTTRAQDSVLSAPTAPASLSVFTDAAGAYLLVNGREAGSTPVILDSLEPGTYILHITHPEPGGWLTESVTDTLTLAESEVRSVTYLLRAGLLINTVPSGASVELDDSLTGVTPLILRRRQFGRAEFLTLSLTGYEKVRIPVASVQTGAVTIPLARRWTPDAGGETLVLVPGTEGNRTLPIVLSGIGAILAGATAAHLKIEADHRTDAFHRTQDAGLLAQRDRLDRAAAVSLIVMQVGIGIFMYLLFSG